VAIEREHFPRWYPWVLLVVTLRFAIWNNVTTLLLRIQALRQAA
jgi:hypothetical protein